MLKFQNLEVTKPDFEPRQLGFQSLHFSYPVPRGSILLWNARLTSLSSLSTTLSC